MGHKRILVREAYPTYSERNVGLGSQCLYTSLLGYSWLANANVLIINESLFFLLLILRTWEF